MNGIEAMSKIKEILNSRDIKFGEDPEDGSLQFGIGLDNRPEGVYFVIDTPNDVRYRVRAFLSGERAEGKSKCENLARFVNGVNGYMGPGFLIANDDGGVGYIHYEKIGTEITPEELVGNIVGPMNLYEKIVDSLEEYMGCEPEDLVPPEQAAEAIFMGNGSQGVGDGTLQ